ncbi:DUF4123 domain-containing protein [Ralstonia solanacearum]|uniref:DUF4123 domain-containing protein n=1 Tax=Ralstonia pseudosolanacearum TaxID=1310165 RepID=UPI0009030610|nr:DUF4123 domain-containing protein [Ralstonia pseudosolanacearum]APF85643.1 hypothetical protein BCR16_01925 [Ralstonia solanacearum FJAT-1458]QKL70142.1 DUF4123 domain-containing protein [Ralstonia solanacearum]MCD9227532.1 DUF4123 domain-containing protein [Ralstonia pseudosolanacearum]MDO3512650.1 DUF4123 domain-containing protein [Ralstonia pseudosolanacearum]MDO3630328.1 DUF4123 domain-containing protein [Ralstonia pseudosolanacearum]
MLGDVIARLAALRTRMPALRLYALVDGAQYQQQVGAPILPRHYTASLFEGTADAPLAHAGPWLVDVQQVDSEVLSDLERMEARAPAVSWLIAQSDLPGLAQLLQRQLDIRLPDGRTALLRFWDPRVLVRLVQVLEAGQLQAFFADIEEWHMLRDGERVWIGRNHADA